MNQSCKVCNEPAAGFHFGAFTCEGCKSFFGRAHINPAAAVAIECKTGGGRCVIDKKNRTSCKACRLKKCLAAGMSKSGSRYGRRSNWFKMHCILQQQQQQRFPRKFEDKNIILCNAGGYDEDCCYSEDCPRPRPSPSSLPVPLSRLPLLLFDFTPKCYRAPLPRSEHSAFRETVKSDCTNDSDNDDDDANDRPIDLTVRQSIAKDDDDNDDNKNNDTTDKHDTRRRFACSLRLRDYNTDSAAPLDLTRANSRNFGISS